MNGIFTKDNITKVILALMIAAIGYIFNALYDLKMAVHTTNTNLAQIRKQWGKITACEKDIAVTKNNIEWIKKVMVKK